MSKFYTEEMKKYIADNYKGKTILELQIEFNNRFKTNITYKAMKSYLSGHKLKVGRKKEQHRKYKDEQRTKDMTWDAIFSASAPYLFSYVNYRSFADVLKKGINSVIDNNSFFGNINEDCIQTIKIQLNALGLIEVASKQSTGMGVIE